MNLKRNLVLYLLTVLLILMLGSWAYNEVAVKNRPLSPDESLTRNKTQN